MTFTVINGDPAHRFQDNRSMMGLYEILLIASSNAILGLTLISRINLYGRVLVDMAIWATAIGSGLSKRYDPSWRDS